MDGKIKDMDREDLIEEYKELARRRPSISEEERIRTINIWQELEQRANASDKYPECPECGSKNYHQGEGEPLRCSDCDQEMSYSYPKITQQVHEIWSEVLEK